MAQGFEELDTEAFNIISQLIGRSIENAHNPSDENTQALQDLRNRAGYLGIRGSVAGVTFSPEMQDDLGFDAG